MRKAQPSLCRGTSKGLGECRERGGRREGEEERKIREKNRDRDREEEKQRGRKREVKGDRGGRERERMQSCLGKDPGKVSERRWHWGFWG
jgi:hypothetical protein